VKWEFTDATMGYSYGAPMVVKTEKYGWVVILTSGYNNSDGKGYLYIVDPRTGALLEKMGTPTASSGLRRRPPMSPTMPTTPRMPSMQRISTGSSGASISPPPRAAATRRRPCWPR
jgi:hypothetical protein